MAITEPETGSREQSDTEFPDIIIPDDDMRTNHPIHCIICKKEFSSQMGERCPQCGYPVLSLGFHMTQLKDMIESYRRNAGYSSCEKITKKGELFSFGRYRDEEIVWRVLEVIGEKALLLSEKGLDCIPYHEGTSEIIWEDSLIHNWLNGTFYEEAFDEEEKLLIVKDTESIEQGDTTSDPVFLLRLEELRQYLPLAKSRICFPTEYAIRQGAETDSSGRCGWWLRSMSRYPGRAESVSPKGTVGVSMRDKKSVNEESLAVRPVIWIRI